MQLFLVTECIFSFSLKPSKYGNLTQISTAVKILSANSKMLSGKPLGSPLEDRLSTYLVRIAIASIK